MNEYESIKNVKYIRAACTIRAGFGVSGNISVHEGCVGEVINKNDWPDSILVDLAGIGVRGIVIKWIEPITEKEYFKGLLKG